MTLALAYGLALVGVGAALVARLSWARRQEQERSIFRVVFPHEVKADQVVAFLAGLSGRTGDMVTAEIAAGPDGIVHRLIVPGRAADVVASQLRAAIPGVRLLPDESPLTCTSGWELALSSSSIPLRCDDPVGTSRAILAALSSTRTAEVVVQLTLTPKRHSALLVPGGTQRSSLEDRLSASLTDLLRGRRTVSSSDELRRLTQKSSTPLFRAALRIGARSDDGMAPAAPVVAVLNSLRAPGVQLRRRVIPGSWVIGRINARRVPALVWPLVVNAAEITAALGWPLDSPIIPGLTVGGTPHLPPVSALPSTGLVLGHANYPGMERPVAIGFADALRHLYSPSPTGAGKSSLATNLAIQQMDAGYGAAVMDPKGDLIDDLLERIPRHREDDVIVVDPKDERPVGINLLDGPDGEDDLTADQVVGVFARRFGSAWGPRTDDIARAAVLTLLADSRSTLADLPMLFSQPAFRRSLVGKVTDPTLAQFWQSFESWSEAERAHNIAPLLNKARAVLMRRPVRAIVGQPSTISLDAVLQEGRILLVDLSAGLLGDDAASLLGGLIFARLWAAVQRRRSIPKEERRPFFATLDEFQTLISSATPLEDVLALARGYGFGLTLMHQNLSQIPRDIREAALANCRTKVVFATGASDAVVLAREFAPWIDAPGLVGLGAFEVVIGASVGATRLPPCTAVTLPPPPALGRAALTRAASRKKYGRDPAEIEEGWRRRTDPDPVVTPIGRKRTSA